MTLVQIDSTHNNSRITSTPRSDVKKTTPAEPVSNATGTANTSAQFEPSMTNDGARDIDAARVSEIRQAISEGKLELSPERIADGIIASARELISESR